MHVGPELAGNAFEALTKKTIPQRGATAPRLVYVHLSSSSPESPEDARHRMYALPLAK
jgi:hypothetical protein